MTTVLDHATLARASRAPGASAFPFLRPYGKKVKPGCCGESTPAGPTPRSAVETVVRLPPARLAAFKALIGADRILVWVVRAGKMVRVEI